MNDSAKTDAMDRKPYQSGFHCTTGARASRRRLIGVRDQCFAFIYAGVIAATCAVYAGDEPQFFSIGNLNTQPISQTIAPAGEGATVPGKDLMFAGTNSEYGTELWRYTGGGATMLLDIRPGPASSNPSQITPAYDSVLFVADDGLEGPEIWRADASTVTRYTDIQPGTNHPAPTIIGSSGGWVWFTTPKTSGLQDRTEIWATRGTMGAPPYQVGTVAENSIVQVSTVPNKATLLFIASPVGSTGSNLYSVRSDAMLSVAALRSAGQTVLPNTPVYAATPGFVCFHSVGINAEPMVWTYSGSPTVLLDIDPTGNSAPTHFVSNGADTICFAAKDATNGRELWRTHGPGDTALVHDTTTGAGSSNPQPVPMSLGQPYVFYQVETGATTRDLWHADLAAATQQRVATKTEGWSLPTMIGASELAFALSSGGGLKIFTVKPPATSALSLNSEPFTSIDKLWNHSFDGIARNPYVIGTTPFTGTELHRVGATSLTTYNLASGSTSSNPRWFSSSGSTGAPPQLFAADVSGSTRLYEITSSGSPSERTMTIAQTGDQSSHPSEFTELNGVLLFTANDANGRSLWETNGRPHNESRLSEVTEVEQLVRFGDRVFFLAKRASGGPGVKEIHFATVGPTGNVTVQVFPNSANMEVSRLIVAGGKLFYISHDHPMNEVLRCVLSDFTDGEPTQFPIAPDGSGITDLTSASGRLYFSAYTASHQRRLRSTDGTLIGQTIAPTTLHAGRLLGALGDVAIFTSDGGSYMNLWRWNGAADFSVIDTLARNAMPRQRSDGKASGIEFNGEFVFTDCTGLAYATNGSSMRTVTNSISAATVEHMAVAGGQLFFFAKTGPSTWRLFTMNATGAVTVVASFGGEMPGGLLALGDKVFFSLSYGTQANLWQSDGTPQGTVRFPPNYDLARRHLGGYAMPMGSLRGHLVLPREDNGTGLEPALVNRTPRFASAPVLTGAKRNLPFNFTYADLLPQAPTDGDGDPLTLSIANVFEGTLWKNGAPVVTGEAVTLGDTFTWEPPAGASGWRSIVTLAAADGFTSASQTYGVEVDSPLDLWRKAVFTPDELLYLEVSGSEGHADGDGINNALEFVFGRQATVAETEPAWTAEPVEEAGGVRRLRFRFVRAATLLEGTNLTVEQSANLATWEPVATKFENGPWSGSANVVETPLADGRVQVEVTCAPAVGAPGSPNFVHLSVQL